jgi:hypothetical protein
MTNQAKVRTYLVQFKWTVGAPYTIGELKRFLRVLHKIADVKISAIGKECEHPVGK